MKTPFWIIGFRFIIIILLIAGLFAAIFLNMRYHKAVRHVEKIRGQLRTIRRQNEAERIFIARSHPLADLEQEAKSRLNMISPKKVEFIYINE